MSNSTSSPSSRKKPSCMATKSLSPMPFGATDTLAAMTILLAFRACALVIYNVTRIVFRNDVRSRRYRPGKVLSMKRTRGRSGAGSASDRGGVQSVTVAALILNALAMAGGRVALKTLAAETGLARAKVHRYLRSLRTAGLVSQQPDTSLYQLGPQAIAIGLAALRGVHPVAEVCNALPALRDNINQTVTAAVWSEAGPILVAMQESDHWLTMNIRIGSRLPVLTSAIGRIFLAYLPEPDVAALVAAERKTAQAHGTELPSADEMHDLTAEIRRRRLARIPSPLVPGIDALAAPVFDFTNKLV